MTYQRRCCIYYQELREQLELLKPATPSEAQAAAFERLAKMIEDADDRHMEHE